MVKLAMYKGKGKLGNAFIRWWTNSQYSHCEIVVDGLCYSSSLMDKGVRKKWIDLEDGKWDVIDIPWANDSDVIDYFAKTDHYTYGWLGLIKSQLFNRADKVINAPFCSEWCADSINIPSAQLYNPKTLYTLVVWLNEKLKT